MDFDVPFVVLLVGGIVSFLLLVYLYKTNALDLMQAVQDETGKTSAARLLSFSAFWAMFWALMYDTYKQGRVDWVMYVVFGVFWSGSPIAYEIVRKWDGTSFRRAPPPPPEPPPPLPSTQP